MFEVARRKMLFKSSCVYVSLFEVLGECDRPSVLFLIGSHHCVCVCAGNLKPSVYSNTSPTTHPPATKYALYYVNAQTLISWKLNGKRYWHQENIRFTCELKNIFHSTLASKICSCSKSTTHTNVQQKYSLVRLPALLMQWNPFALLEDDIKSDMYLIRQVISAKCAAGCQ